MLPRSTSRISLSINAIKVPKGKSITFSICLVKDTRLGFNCFKSVIVVVEGLDSDDPDSLSTGAGIHLIWHASDTSYPLEHSSSSSKSCALLSPISVIQVNSASSGNLSKGHNA